MKIILAFNHQPTKKMLNNLMEIITLSLYPIEPIFEIRVMEIKEK